MTMMMPMTLTTRKRRAKTCEQQVLVHLRIRPNARGVALFPSCTLLPTDGLHSCPNANETMFNLNDAGAWLGRAIEVDMAFHTHFCIYCDKTIACHKEGCPPDLITMCRDCEENVDGEN